MRLKNLYLSHWSDEREVYVPESVVAQLKNYHYDSVRFLYNCHRKNLQGAILNQDDDMNFAIQISAFLRAIKSEIDGRILVLAAPASILAWHYHLSEHAGFTPKIITPEDVDSIQDRDVLITTASDLKLLQSLSELDFLITVVEDFDIVIKRLVLRKLRGSFNIGLTCRNFVLNPDLKLMWKMLHWCNPSVVGKIDEFFENGFDSEYNLCEPYSDLWLRITWNFSDNFKKEGTTDRQEYLDKLESWALRNDLNVFTSIKKAKKTKKRDSDEDEETDSEDTNDDQKRTTTNNKKKTVKKAVKKIKSDSKLSRKGTKRTHESEIKKETDTKLEESNTDHIKIEKDQDSSLDTIISDKDYSEYQEYVQLPNMNESPVLSNITKNFELTDLNKSDVKQEAENSVLSFLFDQPSTSKSFETSPIKEDPNKAEDSDNEILNSLIG